ncbi:unnamed protein product [Hyaloperonospora brassicae]|uniref:alpha-1,2-Mannosidase n=1 Tax=Hyaloperonospora brassicae TaxID=162125 RepID=A0AAV0UPD8_HYABA|nr:unnamed protein product [Hyaloperonospora brassicae]
MWCAFTATSLLSIALVFVARDVLRAAHDASSHVETQAPALLRFHGNHTLSGASYQAFKNSLKRQIRGDSCLMYHVADTWWYYEWCVDRHVRQFHTLAIDQVSSSGEESILVGVHSATHPQAFRVVAVNNLLELADPDRMGYMAQELYNRGDFCEESGASRSVKVQVKCCLFRDDDTYIDSVNEHSPCEYELTVCSPVACGLMQGYQFQSTTQNFMGGHEREALTRTVRDMFYHAYNGYLTHAFPQGDLQPLSCRGGKFELGQLPMLTLIDTLDTLAVFEDATEFRRAVGLVLANANFDIDTNVSVFETTIRVLGGLLSAHLFAVNADLKLFPEGGYENDALLRLAVDVADRLMPAFNTTTGIPYGTVNLKHGVPKGETPISSTAGAGSLSVEFTMLSVLTGDSKYAAASRGAVRALFQRRSNIGLLGKHINTTDGHWTETTSGPGSNSDSFYEYLLKMYELFGDRESLEMFAQVYPSVLAYNKHGNWYTDVSMYTGCHHRKAGGATIIVESLASFWPGVQVGAGDLSAAAKSVNSFYRIWRDYGFLPEHFNVGTWEPVKPPGAGGARYPLRPELIESTFYMHEATNDSSWLRAGAHVIHSLQTYAKTPCGYASIADVVSKKQEDYMPSFFLSETCKYLYLLFNTSHFFRQGNYVLTTEAHPLPILSTKVVAPILQASNADVNSGRPASGNRFSPELVLQCKVPTFYDVTSYSLEYEDKVTTLTPGCSLPAVRTAQSSKNSVSAKKMLATAASKNTPLATTGDDIAVSAGKEKSGIDSLQQGLPAWKERLRNFGGKDVDDGLLDQLLKGRLASRDVRSTEQNDHGLAVQRLYGGSDLGEFRVEQLPDRLRVTRERTGDWIEASGILGHSHILIGLGPHDGSANDADAGSYTVEKLREEKPVQGNDNDPPYLSWMHAYKVDGTSGMSVDQRCSLRYQVGCSRHPGKAQPNEKGIPDVNEGLNDRRDVWSTVPCIGADFGAASTLQSSHAFPIMELVAARPAMACSEVSDLGNDRVRGKMVLIRRGDCYFEAKARHAAKQGAAGVIIVNTEDNDQVMVMSGMDGNSDKVADEPLDIPVVMVPLRLGEWFETRLAEAQALSLSPVKVSVEIVVRDHRREVSSDDGRSIAGDRSFPWVDGVAGNMRVYGPLWGIDLVDVNLDTETSQGQDDTTGTDARPTPLLLSRRRNSGEGDDTACLTGAAYGYVACKDVLASKSYRCDLPVFFAWDGRDGVECHIYETPDSG